MKRKRRKRINKTVMTGAALSIKMTFLTKIEAKLKVSIHQVEVEEEASEEEVEEAEITEVGSEEDLGE